MIIDVIDMEDPVLGGNRAQWLSYLGARSVRIELYGMCNGVGQMIQEITDRAPIGGLDVLRVWSHGASGGQTVSGGQAGEAYHVAHWTGVSVANIDALRDTLAELTPFFSPRARVELRGCSVAQGERGDELLRRLAEIWGVKVQAATIVQETGEWSGPVHEALPSGGMCCTTGTSVRNNR